ncbi:hypothetical protein NDU88_000751 [Pleurodeles waltl]|uniref:Uncharacterized protein n=1 Tax=Pleurodeles waltl TaxID=8319 RepID=A0AAV7MSS0_PLEWA|nr:hypothetical protein NDU88_000751 [Pleurodeles waltl]
MGSGLCTLSFLGVSTVSEVCGPSVGIENRLSGVKSLQWECRSSRLEENTDCGVCKPRPLLAVSKTPPSPGCEHRLCSIKSMFEAVNADCGVCKSRLLLPVSAGPVVRRDCSRLGTADVLTLQCRRAGFSQPRVLHREKEGRRSLGVVPSVNSVRPPPRQASREGRFDPRGAPCIPAERDVWSPGAPSGCSAVAWQARTQQQEAADGSRKKKEKRDRSQCSGPAAPRGACAILGTHTPAFRTLGLCSPGRGTQRRSRRGSSPNNRE